MILNFKKGLPGILILAMLSLASCQNTTPIPPQVSTPQKPTSQPATTINEEMVLFYSTRENSNGWYIMKPDGSNVKRMSFENLPGLRVDGLRWVPQFNAFTAQLSDATNNSDLYLIDVEGNILERITNSFHSESNATYSAAAGKFAFICVESDLDICVVSPDGSNLVNLTLVPSREGHPQWLPSGERVIFVSNRLGVPGIWSVKEDGTELMKLNDIQYPEGNPAISPDGEWIAFESQRDFNSEIYIMDINGQNAANLTNHPANDTEPRWSPDGNHIAFRSDREGGHDLYIMTIDGSQAINITQSPDIQEQAFIWSGNSDKIFYSAPNGENYDIFAVTIDGSNKMNLTDYPADDVDPQWIGK